MLQNYEIYLIIQPEANSEKVSQTLTELNSFLSDKLAAQNMQVAEEGLKKLAYPIKHKKTGFYALLTFDLDLEHTRDLQSVERMLNLSEDVIRYIIVNQTDYNKLKSQETLREVEIKDHRELNKGSKKKNCIVKYTGLKDVDYKDVEFLNQFVSPYSKIFARERTGTSAKYQRKINKAIKRARHMALMSFTPQV
jgi:small subunit ribosomal protein S18